MHCLPRASYILCCFLAFIGVACEADDDRPPPITRHVTAHALVWNGRDHLPEGTPPMAPHIFVFDAPVRCSDVFANRTYRDAPTQSVSLEVLAKPDAWVSGAKTEIARWELYDRNGQARGLEERDGLRPFFTAASIALLTAPTTRGSRAKVRLDMRVLYALDNPTCEGRPDEHILDLTGDIEAEVCGDIQ